MQYSVYIRDNERIATDMGQRDIVNYDEVLAFCGGTVDDMQELLLDVLNGVYAVDDCIKDIKEYKGL